MSRTALTLQTAQKKLDEKFPAQGLVLKSYTKATLPCVVYCPLHGESTVSSWTKLLNSPKGCPTCGRVAARKQATLTTRQRSTDADILQRIRTLGQTTQDDVQFAQAVRQLLSTSDT